MIGDILRDHGAGAYEGVFTQCVAADDGAVGTQGGALFDDGRTDLVHLGDFRPGVVDVCEDHRGAAEDAVFEGDTFVDADVVLDFALISDRYIRPDDDILADVAVFTDFGAGEDVREVPDFGAFADFDTLVNNSCWMNIYFRKNLGLSPIFLGKNRDRAPIFFQKKGAQSLIFPFFLFEGLLADLQYF